MSSLPRNDDVLADLAARAVDGGPGLAAATVRAEVELMLADPARPSSLVLALLPMADEATARLIARRLARAGGGLTGALADVLAALWERGGGPAEILASDCADLPTQFRQTALLALDPRLPVSLAMRADLTPTEVATLMEREERVIHLALLRNEQAPMDRALLQRLVADATDDILLAEALLNRPGADIVLLAPLHGLMTPSQRRLLREAVSQRGRLGSSPARTRLGATDEADLLDASIIGLPAFVDSVATRLGAVGTAFTAAAVADATREHLVVGLAALGATEEFAIRLLLRTGDAVALSWPAIQHLVAVLRETDQRAAMQLLALVHGETVADGRGQHQPAMQPGGVATERAAPGRKPQRPAAALDRFGKRA